MDAKAAAPTRSATRVSSNSTAARLRTIRVIEVASAGVNPSDVKATLGLMPHAVWPRMPGPRLRRRCRRGPAPLLGREVWGSGGELGIRRDGTHRGACAPRAAVREKPAAITLAEAGAIGVPFVTAYRAARRGLRSGRCVLVFGGNGKVGQAVPDRHRAGARVFGVERTPAVSRPRHRQVSMLGPRRRHRRAVREATGGHGADIVYNTVGSPYFEAANRPWRWRAQIFISTIDRAVPFDIFAFYRGQHRFWASTRLHWTARVAAVLEQLRPIFAAGR